MFHSGPHTCEDGAMLSRRFATIVTLVIIVAFVVVAVAPAFACLLYTSPSPRD